MPLTMRPTGFGSGTGPSSDSAPLVLKEVVAPGDPDSHHHSARAAGPADHNPAFQQSNAPAESVGVVCEPASRSVNRGGPHGIRKRLIVVAAWYPAAHHPVARPILALITDVGAGNGDLSRMTSLGYEPRLGGALSLARASTDV
jgi:hypothetical protein